MNEGCIMDNILEIKNLSVEYRKGSKIIPALRNISISLKKKEILGIVGESGCGKSTLAQSILRLIPEREGKITSGSILFREAPTTVTDLLKVEYDNLLLVRGKRISMIFQDPFNSLNPVFKIGDQLIEAISIHEKDSDNPAEYKNEASTGLPPNVLLRKTKHGGLSHPWYPSFLRRNPPKLYPPTPYGLRKGYPHSSTDSLPWSSAKADRIRTRILSLLAKVQLQKPELIMDSYPHQLSGGMLQRVMIAMALSCSPDILVADEPTTALDVTIQKEILELLKKLQEELELTIILISHNLSIISRFCSRVIILYAGTIMEDACSEDIFKKPLNPYTVGLLESLPGRNYSRNAVPVRLKAISGQVPDMASLPDGCKFSPRCPYMALACTAEEPELLVLEKNHLSRCYFTDEFKRKLACDN